ncbi:flagellar protein [Lachnospiraceae bacterium]|nr:flagellar protein [Lachnospiraceae bacterium]
MDVRNCKKCGKLFNYVSGPMICQNCKEELEEKFQEVKKYVSEHPGCGIPEVTEECDVTPNQIKQWLREERLEFSTNTQVGLTCENCGVPVRSGRFCSKCKNSMANDLQGMYKKKKTMVEKKPDTKDNPRMHFLDR